MESNELFFAKGVLLRLSQAAREDRTLALEIRELVLQSGILHVFGEGPAIDPLSVLEAGGEGLLRARLSRLPYGDLRKIVAANGYDAHGATSRWRSPPRFVELIVTSAIAQRDERQRALLEQQYAIALAAASAVATPQPEPSAPEPEESRKGASWML